MRPHVLIGSAVLALCFSPLVLGHGGIGEDCSLLGEGDAPANDGGSTPEEAREFVTGCDGHLAEGIDETDFLRHSGPRAAGMPLAYGIRNWLDFCSCPIRFSVVWIEPAASTVLAEATLEDGEEDALVAAVPADATLDGRAYVRVDLVDGPDSIVGYGVHAFFVG